MVSSLLLRTSSLGQTASLGVLLDQAPLAPDPPPTLHDAIVAHRVSPRGAGASKPEEAAGHPSAETHGKPQTLSPKPKTQKREFFIDILLVRIRFIIVMIRGTGLAPWELEFPFPKPKTLNPKP